MNLKLLPERGFTWIHVDSDMRHRKKTILRAIKRVASVFSLTTLCSVVQIPRERCNSCGLPAGETSSLANAAPAARAALNSCRNAEETPFAYFKTKARHYVAGSLKRVNILRRDALPSYTFHSGWVSDEKVPTCVGRKVLNWVCCSWVGTR